MTTIPVDGRELAKRFHAWVVQVEANRGTYIPEFERADRMLQALLKDMEAAKENSK